MALSTNLIDYVTQTTQSGTSTDVATQPGDNCHTIIALNLDETNTALFGVVANGLNLSSTNSATLAAGATLTLRIGTKTYRPCGALGANVRVRVEGVGGTPAVSFQYINSAQDVAP